MRELHYAHGFLLNAFLSPLTNDRQDKPLFVRLSAVDGSSSGWTIDGSVAFAAALKAVGVDVVDCSSGGFGVYEYPSGYGFQVPFAAQIRREAKIGTMAAGLIIDPWQAEAVIASGQANLVALGHVALRDPHFPLHAQQKLGIASPNAAYADWNIQAGWWLDNRETKLHQLGPWAPTVDAAADNRRGCSLCQLRVAGFFTTTRINNQEYKHEQTYLRAGISSYHRGAEQVH
ncbi:hypothetical protein TMM008_05130 [Pseudomonas sp. 008]|nr:hypothetical protein TMM008_05130 [Pseudomonas sp. 008]